MRSKDFVKEIWTKIQSKWLAMTGRQPCTALSDDIEYAISDELDDFFKVYRYDSNNLNAGIRSDP
jgi:hypothetical protein